MNADKRGWMQKWMEARRGGNRRWTQINADGYRNEMNRGVQREAGGGGIRAHRSSTGVHLRSSAVPVRFSISIHLRPSAVPVSLYIRIRLRFPFRSSGFSPWGRSRPGTGQVQNVLTVRSGVGYNPT